jgi:acetyl/propionyl-CoA carboxylase alpha subunit
MRPIPGPGAAHEALAAADRVLKGAGDRRGEGGAAGPRRLGSLLRDHFQREAQIARLARDGLSNPEIGARLFISDPDWHPRPGRPGSPRLQVEHTVTEEVLGVDLVRAQLEVAAGTRLDALGFTQDRVPVPSGCAIQARVNAETLRADGTVVPHPGTVTRVDLPTGAGVRVETAAGIGEAINPRFDPLLAKIVVHDRSGSESARRRALAALRETAIAGVPTNLALQSAILADDRFACGEVHTRFVDEHAAALLAAAAAFEPAAFEPAAFDPAGPARRNMRPPPSRTVRSRTERRLVGSDGRSGVPRGRARSNRPDTGEALPVAGQRHMRWMQRSSHSAPMRSVAYRRTRQAAGQRGGRP